jgi:hypothetical protein
VKTRTHFAHSIDRLDDAGELFEHLAGIEDFELAQVTYQAAVRRWPDARIMLRQGACSKKLRAAYMEQPPSRFWRMPNRFSLIIEFQAKAEVKWRLKFRGSRNRSNARCSWAGMCCNSARLRTLAA